MRFSGRRVAISQPMPGRVSVRTRLPTPLKPSGCRSAFAAFATMYSARDPTGIAAVSSARVVASARKARRLTTGRRWSAGHSQDHHHRAPSGDRYGSRWQRDAHEHR